jgi:hypothetical protein
VRKLAILLLAIPVLLSVVTYLLSALFNAVGTWLGKIGSLFGVFGLLGALRSPFPWVASLLLVGLGVALVRCSLPYRAHRTVCDWLRVRKGTPRRERPRLRWAWRQDRHVWLVAWRMPVRAIVEGFNQNSAVMDEQIDASTRWWFDRGWVWMEAGTARLPRKVEFSRFAGFITSGKGSNKEVIKAWLGKTGLFGRWNGWRSPSPSGRAG